MDDRTYEAIYEAFCVQEASVQDLIFGRSLPRYFPDRREDADLGWKAWHAEQCERLWYFLRAQRPYPRSC
jgi:hypothetical protein